MATRGAVAVRNENGEIRGRYVHWDGDSIKSDVERFIERDGIEKVVQTIILDNYGWSHLDSTLKADEVPALGSGYEDGRFKAIAGYGVAYTTKDDQSRPDMWIESLGEMMTEYIVIIEDDGSLSVLTDWEDE